MMKTAMTLAALLLGSTTGLIAQESKPAPEVRAPTTRPFPRVGAAVEQALAQLDLTPEQRQTIQPIMDDARGKLQAAREQQDTESARTIIRDAVMKASETLTPEQRAKLRELMQNAPQLNAFDPIRRIENAMRTLDLSEQQKTQVKELLDSYRPQFEEIRKQTGDDRQTAAQQARPMIQELRQKLIAILTPEQTEKLRSLIERPGTGADADRPAGQRARNRDAATR